MDIMSAQKRSALMSRIRGQDTGPELVVRRLLFRAGYRYRLYPDDLPGRPDLVFPGRRKAIFVHGCFWHLHERCANATVPRTRRDFWLRKLQANRERDEIVRRRLEAQGWAVLIVWECETYDTAALFVKLKTFLESPCPNPPKQN